MNQPGDSSKSASLLNYVKKIHHLQSDEEAILKLGFEAGYRNENSSWSKTDAVQKYENLIRRQHLLIVRLKQQIDHRYGSLFLNISLKFSYLSRRGVRGRPNKRKGRRPPLFELRPVKHLSSRNPSFPSSWPCTSMPFILFFLTKSNDDQFLRSNQQFTAATSIRCFLPFSFFCPPTSLACVFCLIFAILLIFFLPLIFLSIDFSHEYVRTCSQRVSRPVGRPRRV